MAVQSGNVAAFVFGGIFIGAWLYGLLFYYDVHDPWPEPGPWALWGMIGLIIPGGIYGALMVQDTARYVLFTIIGILLGMLFLAMVTQEEAMLVASLLTGVGGAIIVAGLPRQAPPAPAKGRGKKA